ncbi:MAG TPA: hypothetical protein DCM28_01010 [Phycisphaerales bacterium]|nr:hypothetical protein [Phycisphaerales bacterium]
MWIVRIHQLRLACDLADTLNELRGIKLQQLAGINIWRHSNRCGHLVNVIDQDRVAVPWMPKPQRGFTHDVNIRAKS